MTERFNYTDIGGLAQIKEGRVWLLKGKGQDELIIKMEEIVTQEVLKGTSPIVKAIDERARMKAMSTTEIDAMLDFCKLISQTSQAHRLTFPRKNLNALILSLSGRKPFAKLQKQFVLSFDVALKARMEGNEDPMRRFVEQLMSGSGLIKLGMIIAGDAFTDNKDRFDYSENAWMNTLSHNGQQVQSTVIANFGNLMLAGLDQKNLSLSFLDYVDPSSMATTRQWNLPLSNEGRQWTGMRLLTREGRVFMATKVIDALEAIIDPPPHKFTRKRKIHKNAVSLVTQGIESGIVAIVTELKERVNKQNKGGAKLATSLEERYLRLRLWK
jgi:hypothetical protein